MTFNMDPYDVLLTWVDLVVLTLLRLNILYVRKTLRRSNIANDTGSNTWLSGTVCPVAPSRITNLTLLTETGFHMVSRLQILNVLSAMF